MTRNLSAEIPVSAVVLPLCACGPEHAQRLDTPRKLVRTCARCRSLAVAHRGRPTARSRRWSFTGLPEADLEQAAAKVAGLVATPPLSVVLPVGAVVRTVCACDRCNVLRMEPPRSRVHYCPRCGSTAVPAQRRRGDETERWSFRGVPEADLSGARQRIEAIVEAAARVKAPRPTLVSGTNATGDGQPTTGDAR